MTEAENLALRYTALVERKSPQLQALYEASMTDPLAVTRCLVYLLEQDTPEALFAAGLLNSALHNVAFLAREAFGPERTRELGQAALEELRRRRKDRLS